MRGILCLAISAAKRLIRLESLLLSTALATAGCASQGPTDNPVVRTVQWFSYLNGDDLRATCRVGGPDRVRLVYNGVWTEQVRAYDITTQAAGDAVMETRVFGGEPFQISLNDPFAFGRGRTSLTRLSTTDLSSLGQTLTAAGFEAAAPDGQFLGSDNYYWVAMACRGVQFHFNAWQAPSPAFDHLGLAQWLSAHDATNLAFNLPGDRVHVPNRTGQQSGPGADYDGPRFDLQIGNNGLRL